MSREFQDGGLQTWEVYASSGPFGFARPARIVFHCLSDPSLRARVLLRQADRAEAERTVEGAEDEELRSLLAQAAEVD